MERKEEVQSLEEPRLVKQARLGAFQELIQCHRLPARQAAVAEHADVTIDEAEEFAHAVDLQRRRERERNEILGKLSIFPLLPACPAHVVPAAGQR